MEAGEILQVRGSAVAVQMDKGDPKRETGVIFKPFVFGVFLGGPPKKLPKEAAPLPTLRNTALEGGRFSGQFGTSYKEGL